MSNDRNRKHQRGSIRLRGSSFYIRYYGGDRRQRTEFLCKLDEKHRSKTCRPGERPRVDTSLTEEQIGRRFGRMRKFVRDLIDNNFPSWDDYRRRRERAGDLSVLLANPR